MFRSRTFTSHARDDNARMFKTTMSSSDLWRLVRQITVFHDFFIKFFAQRKLCLYLVFFLLLAIFRTVSRQMWILRLMSEIFACSPCWQISAHNSPQDLISHVSDRTDRGNRLHPTPASFTFPKIPVLGRGLSRKGIGFHQNCLLRCRTHKMDWPIAWSRPCHAIFPMQKVGTNLMWKSMRETNSSSLSHPWSQCGVSVSICIPCHLGVVKNHSCRTI